MGWLGGFLRRLVLGVFCDSAGGICCDSGRVFGYGKGFFLHQWWFSATVTGVYYIGARPQRSVGWLGGFLRRSVLGVFCDSAGKVFATVERFLATARVFFASVVVFWDGNPGLLRRRRSTAERSIKKTSSWATVK